MSTGSPRPLTDFVEVIRWAAILPVAGTAYAVTGMLVSVVLGAFNPSVVLVLAGWILSDWLGTYLFMVSASRIAPRYKATISLVAFFLLAVLHLIMFAAAGKHPIAPVFSGETIVVTACGGLVIAGLVCYRQFVEQRERSLRSDLAQKMLQLNRLNDSPMTFSITVQEGETTQHLRITDPKAAKMARFLLLLLAGPAQLITYANHLRTKKKQAARPTANHHRHQELMTSAKSHVLPQPPTCKNDRLLSDTRKASRPLQ